MEKSCVGTSLVVQWLRLCTCNAGGTGSIPDRGTKILQAARHNPPSPPKKVVEAEKVMG